MAAVSNQNIHVSAKCDYPQAEPLPLPSNIDPNESVTFSPQRARDISSTAIATNMWNQRTIDITLDTSHYNDTNKSNYDPHVDSYDCRGSVSLNSAMQSNVPTPFGGNMHNYTHLNMPGGQWSQGSKFMSHDLQSSHYINLRREVRKNILNDELKQQQNATSLNGEQQGMVVLKNKTYLHGLLFASNTAWTGTHFMKTSLACSNLYARNFNGKPQQIPCRWFSTDKKDASKSGEVEDTSNKQIPHEEGKEVALTQRAKLKNAIRDYGSTVLVFHIAISLVSLGIFYQLVSRYVEMKVNKKSLNEILKN